MDYHPYGNCSDGYLVIQDQKNTMTCPNCHIELECPCKNCQRWREKEGKIATLAWEWIDGETMRCPICFFEARADVWQDHSIEQFLMEKGTDSLAEAIRK